MQIINNKAAIYIRVSTYKQVEKDYSISEQESKLKALRIAQNISEYKVYLDGGRAGKSILEMPSGNSLR